MPAEELMQWLVKTSWGLQREDERMTEPPRKNLLQERGGRIDPMRTPDSPIDDDERIDEAIAESFPASDPPSFNSGIDRDDES
jgi:hypothetical protein